MGLHLTGKGSILDAIGGALNTAGNAVVSGAKDVGDLGSLGIANLTGNQKAAANARAAISNNDRNLSGGSLATNLGGLSSDLGLTQAAKAALATGFGGGLDIHNALTDDNLTQNNAFRDTPFSGLEDWTTNHNKTNITGARALGENALMTAVNALTAAKGKALESGAEGVAGRFLGDGALGKAGSRIVGGATTAGAYGGGQGTAAAVGTAQNPKEAITDIIKPTVENAALGGGIGTLTAVPGLTRAARDNARPLDEAGGLNNPKPTPPPEPSPILDPEAAIHQANPLAPPEPVTTPPPEPTATDLRNAQAAVDQAAAPPPIDFNQVEGAGKNLAQAVKNRADSLQQMESGLKGGQKQATFDERGNQDGYKRTSEHTPFFRKIYEDTGHAPRKADWLAEAERQLRSGSDEESLNYQHLSRHAAVEKELKDYQAADRQSGYNKVKVRNAPAGVKLGLPSWIKEKINSPEYASKRQSGELLQRIRDELPGLRQEVAAYDRKIKSLKNVNDIVALNKESAASRLKLRALEGMERTQSGEYGRRAEALNEKYPDAVLRKAGKPGKPTVSGEPVSGAGIRVARESKPVELGEGPQGFTPQETKPYTGPNLNEGAFSDEDIRNLESHSGIYSDEAHGSSYSPNHDLTLPSEETTPPPRNLAGDTAAFEALRNSATMDDAVKAYQAATGADEGAARQAVNVVAETGADMGSNEDVLRRNPLYENVADFTTNNAKDVGDKVKSYEQVSGLLNDQLQRAAKHMTDHDIALLDQLRGHPIAEIAQHADDPVQFQEVAQAAKDISDYNHEIRRQNGDITIYRQHYGAGMHYADATPEEKAAVSGYRDTLASTPGFSRERLIGDYGKAANEYNLSRKNANFLEDVTHDQRQTLNFVRDRAVHRGLEDVYGDGAVHYGNPTFDQPEQLNGTRDVFASRAVAKEWNKLNPQQRERTVFGKSYDAINSLVTQLIVLNPFFHGGNQIWQAGEAAGKIPGLGKGGGRLLANMTTMSVDDMRSAALGIYEHGGDIPDYGKNNHGLISRLSHGTTDVARKGMAAVEFRVRTALYKASVDGGMDPREAVLNIEKFMGDRHSFDIANRRFTIFLHYFKTLGESQLTQVLHPIEYRGTIANKIAMLGALYAANYAWQQFTGNKHASIRAPGGAGLIKEEVGTGENLYKHHYRQALSIFTNRINPIPKEAAQQLFNQDLYSGNKLSDSGGRGSHAAGALIAPAQIGGKVVAGKKSAAEVVANELQLNTPHASTAPAAPSGRADFLNKQSINQNGQTIKIKPAKGEDKTGIDQQNAYFDSVEKAKKGLPAARQKVYDQVTAGETDANGNKVGMNDKQAQAHYADLYSNPDVLAAIVKQKQAYAKATGTPLDPLYSDSITADQRRQYLHMQSEPYKGDDYVQQSQDNATGKEKDWIKQLTTDRVAYFATQDFSGAPPSQRVAPPNFDAATQADLDAAGKLDGTDKVKFIDAHPDVQTAYDAIAKYTNDRRAAEGNAPFKLFPHADQQTQALINTYFALPTGDGPKGGNASRAAWIKANPDAYNKIQNYFASEAEWELANSAGQDKFQGNTPSQKELKSAYSLGQYDIAATKNADGTTTYSLDPAAAYSLKQAKEAKSGFAKSAAGFKSASQRRSATRGIKYAGRSKKILIKTFAQDKRKLSRYNPRHIRVAKAPTGKLRVKGTPVA